MPSAWRGHRSSVRIRSRRRPPLWKSWPRCSPKVNCKARFLKVESEHSSLAGCIGAASTGARTFTATSSQGLALMHELLHWAAGARLPIVMVNVNRALGPGWNLWNDQTDSLGAKRHRLDAGLLSFLPGGLRHGHTGL